MPSHNPQTAPDATLERLLARVHAITRPLRDSHWLLSQVGAAAASTHAEIAEERQRSASPPPDCIREALRAPAGAQHIVTLDVYGKPVRAALPAVGYRDPLLEQKVWREIQRVTLDGDAT